MDWYFNLDHDQCVGCGACVFVCTFNGQDILEMGYYPSPYDSELLYFCMDCDGHCLYVCPNEAIEIGKE